MKRLASLMAACVVLMQVACSRDSLDYSDLLLLAGGGPVTVRTSFYDDAGVLHKYVESVFPSASVFLNSLRTDGIMTMTLYPTPLEFMSFMTDSVKESYNLGVDGVPFTADDTFGSYYVISRVSPALIRQINYSDFSGSVAGYLEYQLDASGRVTRRTSYNSPGTDGVWFNGDDVKALYSTGFADAGTHVAVLDVTWTDSNTCSAIGYDIDGTTILAKFSVRRDTAANTLTMTAFKADGTTQIGASVSDYAGHMAIAYTTISNVSHYSTYTLDASGRQSTLIVYNGFGVDATWFTADDEQIGYIEWAYDVDGFPTGYTRYSDNTRTTRVDYSTMTH